MPRSVCPTVLLLQLALLAMPILSLGSASSSAEPPQLDAIKEQFSESERFHHVRVTTTDQLLAAIIDANERVRPTHIDVAAGTYTFSQQFNSLYGTSVLPPVSATILITGEGTAATILDGAAGTTPPGRALTVLSHGRLQVQDLAIRNFSNTCDTDCSTNGGGAAENAGGDLRFENVVLSDNRIYNIDGGATLGGAVLNLSGHLELERTSVSGNSVISVGGGGLAIMGGSAVIVQSLISSNHAAKGCCGDPGGVAFGGGIYVSNARLVVLYSTLTGNIAGPNPGDYDENLGYGAGLYNDAGGQAWVARSAIVGNLATASGTGGGIQNNGSMLITNSTIGGNHVGSHGAGISNAGELSLQGVTLANNVDDSVPFCILPGPGCLPGGNDLWLGDDATTRLATSLIGDCDGGVAITEGHNAFGPGAICLLQPSDSIGIGSTHDLSGVQPGLAALSDNGKPGDAHYPLLVTSVLIDAGGQVGRFCTPRDQLGERRVSVTRRNRDEEGAWCDIGAIEYQPPHH